jgi:hypothetical protein
MAALFGGILLLSLGAYRVLDAWGVYRHAQPGGGAAAVFVDARGGRVGGEAQQQQHRGGARDRQQQQQQQQQEAAAAAAEQEQQQQQQQDAPHKDSERDKKRDKKPKKQQQKQDAAVPAELAGAGSLQGVPGAPQPSPLDSGFARVDPPWAGRDLGDLSLAPLHLREGGLPLPAVPRVRSFLGVGWGGGCLGGRVPWGGARHA